MFSIMYGFLQALMWVLLLAAILSFASNYWYSGFWSGETDKPISPWSMYKNACRGERFLYSHQAHHPHSVPIRLLSLLLYFSAECRRRHISVGWGLLQGESLAKPEHKWLKVHHFAHSWGCQFRRLRDEQFTMMACKQSSLFLMGGVWSNFISDFMPQKTCTLNIELLALTCTLLRSYTTGNWVQSKHIAGFNT